MVFRWNCPSSRPKLRGKGKGGRAQHVNVIPSIDPSSNVKECSCEKNFYTQWTQTKRWCSRDMPTPSPQFILFYKRTWILVTNTFFLVKRMVKRAFISIAPPRECVYLNTSEFFFLPCSSNTRMEGVLCNNVLTPGVDTTLFGKQVRNANKGWLFPNHSRVFMRVYY